MTKSCGVPIPPPRPRQIGAKFTSPAFHHIDLERYPWFEIYAIRTVFCASS